MENNSVKLVSDIDYKQIELRLFAEFTRPIPWYRKLFNWFKYKVLRRRRFSPITGRLYPRDPDYQWVKRR